MNKIFFIILVCLKFLAEDSFEIEENYYDYKGELTGDDSFYENNISYHDQEINDSTFYNYDSNDQRRVKTRDFYKL